MERMSMTEWATAHGISAQAERAEENPNAPEWTQADHWQVTLTRRTSKGPPRTMQLYFSQGYGHGGAPPKLEAVLGALQTDSLGLEAPFEEWATDLGWSPDSRKAERIYRTCKRQAARLQRFLGEALYQELLTQVDPW